MKRKLFLVSLIMMFLFTGFQKKEETNSIQNAEKSDTEVLNKGEMLSVKAMDGDFTIHNGLWYEVENEQGVIGGTSSLVCTDTESSKRKTICEWKGNERSQIGINSIHSFEDMFLCVLYENNIDTGINIMYLDAVSVPDGEKTRIYTGKDGEMLRLAGAGDSKVILEISKQNYNNIMNQDQFLEKYPDQTSEDFDAYYKQEILDNREEALKLYSLDGQEIKTISDIATGYKGRPDNKIFCNEYTVYARKDGLYLYNILEDKEERLAEDKDIVNCFIMDGNVFYVVQKGDEYFYYIVDIENGTRREQKRKNKDGSLPVGIHAESDDLLIGVSEKGMISITKKDYYEENYEKANLVVPFS